MAAKNKKILTVNGMNIALKAKKSEHKDYDRVEIELDDTFRTDLVDSGVWSNEQVDELNQQIALKLIEKEPSVSWEDAEYLVLDILKNTTTFILDEVAFALESLMNHPATMEEIKKNEERIYKAKEIYNQKVEEEYKKIREEEDIFRGYDRKPDAKSPADHHGYLIIERVNIKKAKGISYHEKEFLGELKKEALRPHLVLLKFSTAGKIFDGFYSEVITKKPNHYGFDYQSKLENIILSFAKQSNEVLKHSHRISQVRNRGNEANGEEVMLLCEKEFSNRVIDYFVKEYQHLDNIAL